MPQIMLMCWHFTMAERLRLIVLTAMVATLFSAAAEANPGVCIRAAGFSLAGPNAGRAGTNSFEVALENSSTPFVQSSVKQSSEPALLGPDPHLPYFTVRFAMPIPPENLTGMETDFYENGVKQHEVTYKSGRKTGEETFWSCDGIKIWTWDQEGSVSAWTQYWPNGQKNSSLFGQLLRLCAI